MRLSFLPRASLMTGKPYVGGISTSTEVNPELQERALMLTSSTTIGGKPSVRFVSDESEIEALRGFWLAHQKHPNVELDFYLQVIHQRPEVTGPLVLVVEQNGQPQVLLAGRIEKARERARLGYLTWSSLNARKFCTVSGGLLGDLSEDTGPLMAYSLRQAIRKLKLDYVVLSNLRVDSALALAVRQTTPAWQGHVARTNLHWRISLPESYEEFLGRRKKKHRYWLQRLGRVLERDYPGRVKSVFFRDPSGVEQFYSDATRLSEQTYQRALGAGFSGTAEACRHCSWLASQGTMRGYVLYVDDQPRAYWFASVVGDTLFLHSTGYDPAFRNYEVGTILFLKMIEDACHSGIAKVDFGLGNAAYKERFGDESWEERHHYIFAPTLRGFALNCLMTANQLTEDAARWGLARVQLVARTKRLWRRQLAKHQPSEGSADGCS